jgi:hypothetical protein
MAILEGAQPIPPDLPADLERRVVLQLAPVSEEFKTLRRADTLFSAQSERWKDLLEKYPALSFRPYFSTLRQNADPRLLAYLAIVCPPGVDPESIRSQVVTWPGVELAYVEPLPEPPPLNPTDDPRNANQGYLDAAPTGIDARWAWTLVDGSGMDFVDLERGWTLNHEDLSAAGITIISGLSQDFHGHGTAVLGEVGAVDNTVGCVGIAPNARMRVVSQWRTTTSYSTADAINDAAAALNPGDVLLLEAQTTFNGFTKAPVEVEPAVFTAIRAASDAGIIVVEAGGNGAIDLDHYSDPSGNATLNRGSSQFQDSGAIMVGAGSAGVPHGRLSFSNYGSRIDCYGWGESIDTTGDGWTGTSTTTYTTSFGGTSGASPIVAGSALLITPSATSPSDVRPPALPRPGWHGRPGMMPGSHRPQPRC